MPREPWWRKLTLAGPGLVFVLSIVGPRDLVSNSVAGSEFGYSLIWLLAVAIATRIAILESTARYVIVTGESLVTGCGRAGRWLVWMIFIVPLVKRFITGMVQLALLGEAGHLLFPLPSEHSEVFWALGSWFGAFGVLYWGRYKLVERINQPLAFLLVGSLAAAAFLSRPDWSAALKGALVPSVPEAQSLYGAALVVLSVAMGAIGSIGNIKYAAFVHEKGWRDLSYLRSQRIDLVLSACGMFVMLALIQIAAAGALHPLGIQVAEIEDLVRVFAQVLGNAGRVVLALGVWCVVFTSVTGSATGLRPHAFGHLPSLLAAVPRDSRTRRRQGRGLPSCVPALPGPVRGCTLDGALHGLETGATLDGDGVDGGGHAASDHHRATAAHDRSKIHGRTR